MMKRRIILRAILPTHITHKGSLRSLNYFSVRINIDKISFSLPQIVRFLYFYQNDREREIFSLTKKKLLFIKDVEEEWEKHQSLK